MFYALRQSPLRVSSLRGFVAAVLVAFALSFGAGAILAHHPSSASTARVIDGRSVAPSNQFILDAEYRKGEQENRHRLITTLSAEFAFLDGNLGLTLGLPWHYLAQKNRADAARFGRPRVGFRFRPLLGPLTADAPFFLVLDGDLAAASGSDRGRFLDEDFWEYTAGATIGWSAGDWTLTLRGGGRFPLTRLPRSEAANPLNPLPWEPTPELARRETHDLKKVSEWEARAGYRISDSTSLFAGFAYRTPYAGIIKEKATGNEVPLVYREASAGVSWKLGENSGLRLAYRYPLFRKRDQSPAEKAVSIQLLRRLPDDPREFRLFDESWSGSLIFGF